MTHLKGKNTVIIKDNGPGISSHLLGNVFNPLYTTKNTNKHPGLGLTVAYQILQDHGGNIEINSQPNVGTEVKVSI